MARALNIKNLYDINHSYLPLSGEWQAIGEDTEDSGLWIIYGKEKNGKTTFALKLANYLSSLEKVLYISAEEGVQTNIKKTCLRLNIPPTNKTLHFLPYITFEDIKKRLEKRKSHRIVFIDNTTVYKDEIKSKDITQLLKEHPKKLFIILAHEDNKSKGEPDIALAKYCKKVAKRIFHIVGVTAFVVGRTEDATIPVDKVESALCHNDSLINNQEYGDKDKE